MSISPDLLQRLKCNILRAVGERGIVGSCLSGGSNSDWLRASSEDYQLKLEICVGGKPTADLLNGGGQNSLAENARRVIQASAMEIFPETKVYVSFFGDDNTKLKEEIGRVQERPREQRLASRGIIFGREINPNHSLENLFLHQSAQGVISAAGLVLGGQFLTKRRLLIVGQPGSGKSHLLDAIATEVYQRSPDNNIYITGPEGFQEAYKDAVQEDRARNAIPRSIGDLSRGKKLATALFDDLSQFSPTAGGTLDSLADTFDYLDTQRIPVIMTSNLTADQLRRGYNEKTKGNLTTAQKRILARIEATGTIRLDFPSYEETIGLIKFLFEKLKTPVYDLESVARIIASHIQQTTLSPSYTAGIVDGLRLESAARRSDINPQFVKSALDKEEGRFCLVPDDERQVDRIIDYVARTYDLSPDILKGRGRGSKLVSEAKALIFYIATSAAGQTSTLTSRKSGQKNHTTVLYGARRLKERLEYESSLAESERIITNRLVKACQDLGYKIPLKSNIGNAS